jgi:uncharacterized Rossmann fold enzyme
MATPQPLHIDIAQYGTWDEVQDNIKSAFKRGLPEIKPAPFKHDGTMVIVGSGPSVTQYAEQIRRDQKNGKTICAIKAAHDWLIDNDIIPDCFVSVEPRDRSDQIKHKNEHTVYLLASRVHPAVFDALADCKVMLWHSWSAEKENEVIPKGNMQIGGGTTSGLRAVNVGYILGYRKFKLYGFDSCLSPDKQYKRFTGEKPGQIIDVIVGGKTFYCTGALAQQAQDFQQIYRVMDVSIESVGDGLISAIIDERIRNGLPT